MVSWIEMSIFDHCLYDRFTKEHLMQFEGSFDSDYGWLRAIND